MGEEGEMIRTETCLFFKIAKSILAFFFFGLRGSPAFSALILLSTLSNQGNSEGISETRKREPFRVSSTKPKQFFIVIY
jgi:hypothetical protein